MEKENKKSKKKNKKTDEPQQHEKFKRTGPVKRLVRNLHHMYRAARKKANKDKNMEKKISNINMQLSKKLDQAGYKDLSQEVAKLPTQKSSLFKKILGGFLSKPLAYKIKVLGGGFASFLVMFAVMAFVLVWYRGTDVPVLNKFVEHSPPVLSLDKKNETKYGVGVKSNEFEISASDASFRSLGIANKVSIEPDIKFDIELSADNETITVKPTQELEPGQEYSVTLRKGTMFGNGTSLADDYKWTFRTEPVFAVTGITPRNGSDGVPVDTAIEFEFNYKNINAEEFEKHFQIVPPTEGKFEKHGKKIVFLPSEKLDSNSKYKIIVEKGFANGDGEQIQERYVVDFITSSVDSDGKYIEQSYLEWNIFRTVLSVNQNAWLGVRGSNINTPIEYTLYSVEKEGLVNHLANYDYQFIEKPPQSQITEVGTFVKSFSDSQNFEIEFGDYGIYLLEAYNSDFGRSIFKYIVYTPIGVVSSDEVDSTRVWAFEMGEKELLSDVDLEFYDFQSSTKPVGSDTTDSEGYGEMDDSSIDCIIGEYSGNYAVFFDAQTEMWHLTLGRSGSQHDNEYRTFLYMDKPIYRPGETVRFKMVVRKEKDMDYALPGLDKATIEVGKGGYWYTGLKQLPLFKDEFEISDDFGTVTGEFDIPPNADQTYYNVFVKKDDSLIGSFALQITDFVKPKTKINLTLNKTKAFSDETLRATITGEDYSGNPAANETINIAVSKGEIDGAYWFEKEEDLMNLSDYWGDTMDVQETTIKLDNTGRATYSVDLADMDFDTDLGVYRFRIWTENLQSSSRASALVAQKASTLFARPEKSYVPEDAEMDVDFRTVNLWDLSAKEGVRVLITEVSRTWYEWEESGTRYNPATKSTEPVYERERHSEVVLSDEEFTTDNEGKGTLSFTDLQQGSYRISLSYFDDGEVYKSFDDIFTVYEVPEDVDSSADIRMGDYEHVDIYTDKDEYEVGESANINVKTSLEGQGIFMVYRGETYDWKIIDLDQGYINLQQEMTSQMAPMVNICVWGVDEFIREINGERRFLTNVLSNRCNSLQVTAPEDKLNVDVESNKEVYQPGDKVKLDIKVTDNRGRGIRTELSVNVIDRALLDIVRDTYQNEDEQQPPYGIYEAFYERVHQWSSIEGSMEMYYQMGGFGAGGRGDESTQEFRSDFEDVAHWDGKVYTDSEGRVQVAFELPDNLTTWNVRVLALTGGETKVGEGTMDFVTKQHTSLDADKPQFLYEGDNWKLQLQAKNFSNASASGTIEFKCDKCQTESKRKEFVVGSDDIKELEFEVRPKAGVKEIDLSAKWLDNDGNRLDGVVWEIPILGEGLRKAQTYSSLLEQGEQETVLDLELPDDAANSDGSSLGAVNLELTFARSFVNEAALVSIDPTVSSSVELSSSIIHNSVFCNYYDQIRPREKKSYYEEEIESALNMLEGNQAPNGGFGWFDYDAVNYELSAYVGIALGRAVECGVLAEDDAQVSNLKQYLKSRMDSEEISIDEEILAVYALAVMQEDEILPRAIWLKDNSEKLKDSPLNLAHLMLALQEMEDEGDGVELIDDLEAIANTTERGVTWEETNKDFRLVNSTEYVTAMVYLALSPYEISEYKELARNWLIDNPINVYGNSQDTVGIFYALTVANIDNIEGRKGVNKVNLEINGNYSRNFNVGGDSDWIGKSVLTIDSKHLQSGQNKVKVTRSGKGQLYVVANLDYYSSQKPQSQEFEVKRTIRDFYTNHELDSVNKGQVVSIRTEVKVDRDGYNLIVHDYLPSGFSPVRYSIGNYGYEFIRKWWKWGRNDGVNRYGTVNQNNITFTKYQVKEGESYIFEYPAVAAYSGEFSGGGAQAYLQNFEDVDGVLYSNDIAIKQ